MLSTIAKYEKYLSEVKNYSPKTIETYLKIIKVLIAANYDFETVLTIIKNNKANTKRTYLYAIKSFYKFNNDKRYELIEIPKRNIPITDYISYEEYLKIINNLKTNTLKRKQFVLMIKILYQTGLRSTELLNITKQDVYLNRITIYGKNNKTRYVYLSDILYKEFIDYYKKCSNNVIFLTTYKAFYKKIANLCHILNKKVTPHMFRRGFACYCINHNISIYDISQMLGHTSPTTTMLYINQKYNFEKMKNIFNI